MPVNWSNARCSAAGRIGNSTARLFTVKKVNGLAAAESKDEPVTRALNNSAGYCRAVSPPIARSASRPNDEVEYSLFTFLYMASAVVVSPLFA
jgi:hypothetical protein